MERLIIRGGNKLRGMVMISGAKNAALPILAGSILAGDEVVITSVPDLDDVKSMLELLQALGAKVKRSGSKVVINPAKVEKDEAPYNLIRKMRASFLVAGPLLAKLNSVRIPLPGGCAIGSRPVDLHLKGFLAMGATITQESGVIQMDALGGLRGARIYLDVPSVGATENLLMAASLAMGETVIENAAREPEVVDLANFLNNMGAKIRGAGTSVIKIDGVSGLSGISYPVIPDRIEAGTYMIACAVAGGDITLQNVVPEHLTAVIAKLTEVGVTIEDLGGGLRVLSDKRPYCTDVTTTPYPGFPTDLQPQMMTLLSIASGTSVITETIFEGRFMHVAELNRMGADLRIENRSVIIEGVRRLSGAHVRMPDLRAGAALVLAGIAANGETEIQDIYHLDRGYEAMDRKLAGLGADIARVYDEAQQEPIAQVL
ncbi:MAG: UDP-N-acetylglucosamine 1-carboxyvinyltransferase [Firmicutes bacterium]|nr:UDP-N-acetylglucosamine 1-carboxyvinyltransferase [Bacillota bacterium]